jgi:hypothetical protein
MPRIELVAKSLNAFEDSSFETPPDHQDRFKDAVILPASVFDDLFGADHSGTGYVNARAASSPDDWSRLYALSFTDAHDAERHRVDGRDAAHIRMHIQQRLGCDLTDPAPRVVLEPIEARESPPLGVVRRSTREESTREGTCFVAPSITAADGFEPGDTVEVFNPVTGGRILLTLEVSPTLDPGSIALSTAVRDLLRVELERDSTSDQLSQVRIREPIGNRPSRPLWDRAKTAMLRPLVGTHTIRLRVFMGLNIDEDRNAARVDAETLSTLGIDDGDRVVVRSREGETRVHCHSLSSDSYLLDKDSDLRAEHITTDNLLLPSTEREQCGALVDDVVEVRRDMWYLTGKRITLSLFGIIGVVISGTQTIGLLFPDLPSTTVGSVLLVLSALSVWLILWPDRQRCDR